MCTGCITSVIAETNIITAVQCNQSTTAEVTRNNSEAMLWYRNSVENKAIYRQIMSSTLNQIAINKDFAKLKPKTWGVVFAIDGTLLDVSDFYYNNVLKCNKENPELIEDYYLKATAIATPGATKLTCGIRKLGGYVVVVTNRDGSGGNGKNIVALTQANLTQQKICYDSIIFANNIYDTNKNPRFAAVTTGDYENVIATKQLPAIKIAAYMGTDITDFPDFKQNTAKLIPANSAELDDFGQNYFMLPNPIVGSWQVDGGVK